MRTSATDTDTATCTPAIEEVAATDTASMSLLVVALTLIARYYQSMPRP
ncbi:hypothetical protein [Vibrio taketomensis]|nr:hypothetical protein [Vibrio taketomensis]